MIDSKQDEAVKLEACPVCGGEPRVEVFSGDLIIGEARAWVCSNNRLLGGDCPDQNAYLSAEAWNAHTTPANLNAPDKQEALAGEGVEPCERCYDSGYAETSSGGIWTGENVRTTQTICDCPCGEDVRRERVEALAGDDRNGVEGLADRVVNEIMDAFQKSGGLASILDQCANASAKIRSTIWLHVHEALSRTLPSNEALAGDERNGVEGLIERLRSALIAVEYVPGDHPVVPIKHDMFVKRVQAIVANYDESSRTPSSPQADLERVQEALGGYACLADFADTLALAAQALTAQGAETMGEIAGRAVKVIAALSTMTTRPAGGEEAALVCADGRCWSATCARRNKCAGEDRAKGLAALTKPAALPKEAQDADR